MEKLQGIKYTRDASGNRYVRIDLKQHGDNELLEDFLDGMEAMARKDEPKISLEEFNRRMDSYFKGNV